jgi:hypothetical protein
MSTIAVLNSTELQLPIPCKSLSKAINVRDDAVDRYYVVMIVHEIYGHCIDDYL